VRRTSCPICAEARRLNEHYLDPKRLNLFLERLGESVHRILSCVIVTQSGETYEPADRRNVYDRPAASIAHLRQSSPRNLREPPKIRFKHRPNFRFVALFDRTKVAESRIVY